MTLYDAPSDQPTIKGSHTDSLILGDVPRSWNGTQLKCIVSNNCGVVDTAFLLNVKECFDIADVEGNVSGYPSGNRSHGSYRWLVLSGNAYFGLCPPDLR